MKLSPRTAGIPTSVTFAIDARVRELRDGGVDVIGLGAGQADFPAPPEIEAAVQVRLREAAGMVRYTPAAGLPELRAAAARHVSKVSGVDYEASQLIVTNGAKEGLALAIAALLDPGETLLLPSTCWLSYEPMARAFGVKARAVEVDERNHFKPSAEAIDAAARQGARALLLNSPNNPTGAVLSEAELSDIAEVCRARDLSVISDEIYWPYVWEGRFASIAALPGMAERTVVVNGLSKSHAMTGWRVGFAAGPAEIVKGISSLKSHLSSNASLPAQWAAIAALDAGEGHLATIVEAFARRRGLAVEALTDAPGVQLDAPQGAFYVFPRIDALYTDALSGSVAFCEQLLEEQRLAAIPGAAFGEDRCLRLSIAAPDEQLVEGLARLVRFAAARSG